MKKLIFTFGIVLMCSNAFAETNETVDLPTACCTAKAYDSEGDVLVSVSECSEGSSSESKITACVLAEAKLQDVIEALMP